MKKHEIFKTNPNLKEVHMTSDGQAFYIDNDAKLHAKSLRDKTVELVVNPDHIVVVDEEIEATSTEASTEAEETTTEASTEAEETTTEASTEAEETSTEASTEAPKEEAPKEEVKKASTTKNSGK